AFQFFSFPVPAGDPGDGPLIAVAALPGLLLLIATGVVAWRTLAGLLAGFSLWLVVRWTGVSWTELSMPALGLGVVFLVCDPASGPSTHGGRWAYGFLAGMLIVVLGASGKGIAAAQTVVF